MRDILIVSDDKNLISLITEVIKGAYPEAAVRSVMCCSDGREAALAAEYDLVVIDAALSGAAEGLAQKVISQTTAGCIIAADKAGCDELADRLEDIGILVLPKPVDKALLRRTVKLINASRSRIKGYAKENLKLHRRLDEIKAVNRAKLVLMQYLKFSESQAHKYIEKQSMDLRMTRYEIAMKIIKTYDLDV